MGKLVDLVKRGDTAAAAAAGCAALAQRYRATIKYGPEEPLVGALGAALDALGIQEREAFVRTCAITVGDTIYLPFRPGKGKGKAAVWRGQIATVAHECEHVRQGGDHHLEFWLRYFTSEAHRTEYEVAALAVQMEVQWRLTGCCPDPGELAAGLEWYRCGADNRAIAAKHLAIVAHTLTLGGEISGQIRALAKVL